MFTGSMHGKGFAAFALMGYIIANARPDDGNTVELNPPHLAGLFGEDVKAVKHAIQFLCDQDPDSRSPDENGCRLIKVGTFLYRVVNLDKYRFDENGSLDARRAYWKSKKQMQRRIIKQRNGLEPETPGDTGKPSETVRDIPRNVQLVPHADADADADTKGSVRTPPLTETSDDGIPTLQEVIEAGSITGVTEDSCRRFFDYHEGDRRWLNPQGQLINWRHKLVSWGARDRAKPQSVNGQPRQAFPETQLKALQALIDNHIANPDHSYVRQPTEKDRADFKALKRKLRELQQQIAGV